MSNKANTDWTGLILLLIVLGMVGLVFFSEDIFHTKKKNFELTLSEYYNNQVDKKDFKELDLKITDDEIVAIRNNVPNSCSIKIYNIYGENTLMFNKRIIANNYDLIIYHNNLYINKTTQAQISKNEFINYINTCIEDENTSLVKKEQLKATWKKD